MNAHQRQTLTEFFCIVWDILVQPAIIMAIYNSQLRQLVPESIRPIHMSYGVAICLRIFAACFYSTLFRYQVFTLTGSISDFMADMAVSLQRIVFSLTKRNSLTTSSTNEANAV